MTHVSIYAPRESQIAAFGEIIFLFCLRMARDKHVDDIQIHADAGRDAKRKKYVGKLRELHIPRRTNFHRFDFATRSSSSFFCMTAHE